jgi:hypothetical protein
MKSIIQTSFFNFDSSECFGTVPDSLITSTQGNDFSINPYYRCRSRRGYSLSSDPFNPFRRQVEPADYSRKDIAFSYRVGGGF